MPSKVAATVAVRNAFRAGIISRDQAYRQCMAYAMRSERAGNTSRPWDLLASMFRLAVK